jgi:hypothetical protein
MGDMKMKNTQPTILLAMALTALGASAQQPREGIAQLKSVKGNVLVSRQAGLASGAEATRITEKTRVITTANSEVIVVYDNGCEVRLKENQRFEVEDNKPCAALIAQVQSILPAGGAATQGALVEDNKPCAALLAQVQSILVQPAETSLAAFAFWPLLPVAGAGGIGADFLRPGPGPTATALSPS